MDEEKGPVNAPEFGAGEWINSIPYSIRDLRGRVVLVDFWDYTCVNCLHTLPYVAAWHRRYEPLGLTVVGVHTPEFGFAGQASLIEDAVRRFDLPYPVLVDREYETWQAYANRYWPAKYLIDVTGKIRGAHFGEGAYAEVEKAIQGLLKEREGNAEAEFPPPMEPVRAEDASGAVCYRATPEVYLGFRRGMPGNPDPQPGQAVLYKDHGQHAEGYPYLDGPWQIADEYSARPFGFSSSQVSRLHLKYMSKEVNLVIHPGTSGRAELTLLQDGAPLAAEALGEDAKEAGGRALVVIDTPRMYRLVNNPEIAGHELTIETTSDGVALYAFTFVSCLVPDQQ
ncbi:MAG: redoxin domain-containing protein [Dehalococcoidia bacterium]